MLAPATSRPSRQVVRPVGRSWQAGRAEIERWWPRLNTETQRWLIDNNGDAVPAAVVDEIRRVGGSVARVAAGDAGEVPGGVIVLSDEQIDWIEAHANGEQ